MLVTRVVSPVSSRESWTVLGDDDRPVEPVERYLAYLTGIERSPNTVKAYAHDLKDWFEFLADRALDWRAVGLEDVGAFVAWLRAPAQARGRRVVVLPSVAPSCVESTVNRKLSALGSFYTHAARDGVDVADLLASWQVGGVAWWVDAVSAPHRQDDAAEAAGGVVEGARKLPRVLAPEQVQTLLDGCEHLRDRLLLALLYDTGMRIGEALGLRHNDIAAAGREITVIRRENDNGARAKSINLSHGSGEWGVGAVVCRLSACRVRRSRQRLRVRQFVGSPARAAVDLCRGLRPGVPVAAPDRDWISIRTGCGTRRRRRMLRDGIGVEVVAHLLGPSDVTVTATIYGHLTVEDARRVMEQAGWFDGGRVQLVTAPSRRPPAGCWAS